MRQLLSTILIVLLGAVTTVAQPLSAPASKDSIIENKKFFFPANSYIDSLVFSKAMPQLAGQVLSVYHDEDRRNFFENCIAYYYLTDNYNKIIDLVDSIQQIDGEKSYGIDLKSYGRAEIADKKQPGSFDNVFKKEYSEAFNRLSFRKKVDAATADTSWIGYVGNDLSSFKEKLKKEGKDSLSFTDSRSLCEKFFNYNFLKKTIPLRLPLMGIQYKPMFPAIKSAKQAGVVPVQPIDEVPDPNMQYKLLFEFTGFAFKGQDSAAKKDINVALSEVARLINLHEANGVPRKNLNVAIVAHASALYVFLTNEKYKKKYGLDNPNIPLIKELQDYGVKILACGQAMTFFDVDMADLVPGIKQVLTAQTVISSYQLKGYVYHDMSLRE